MGMFDYVVAELPCPKCGAIDTPRLADQERRVCDGTPCRGAGVVLLHDLSRLWALG